MLTRFLSSLPEDATAVLALLCAASILALFQALRRGPRHGILLPFAFTAASATPLLPAAWAVPLLFASGVVMWRSLKTSAAPEPAEAGSKAVSIACALLLVALSAALSHRLGSFSSEVLVWEGTTIDGLAEDLRSGNSLASLAGEKTLWGDAPLSAGEESLLFALPVLALFKYVSASIVSMRAVALVYFIAACAVFCRFMGRRFGGAASLAALAVLALSEPSLLYARYGGAVSAVLLALVVALALCERLVSTLRLPFAVLAPIALYAATLGYSPARIPAAVLAICTPIGILAARSFSLKRRIGATAVFSALVASVILHQDSDGRQGLLFSGRGEQIFGMSKSGWFPPELLSMRTLSGKQPNASLLPGEKIGVAVELVRQVTAKQLALVVSPFKRASRPLDESVRLQTDPPYWRLLTPSLTPFVLLGFLALFRRRKLWLSAMLILWIAASVGALVLTNRVDTHRAFFLLLPVAIWAAVGADALFRSLCQWIPAPALGAAAIGAVFLFAVLPRAELLYPHRAGMSPPAAAFIDTLAKVPGPVSVVSSLPPKSSAWIRLAILERNRVSGTASAWLREGTLHGLLLGTPSARSAELASLETFVQNGGTIVVSPPSNFLKVATALVERGAETRIIPGTYGSLLLVSRKPSPALDQLAPATELPEPPVPARQQTPPSRAVPLSSIVPDEVVPCSVKPKGNLSHDGNLLRMNDAEFNSGLGLRADTTIRLPVPRGTIALRAMIGIDDEVLPCLTSSAIVRLLGPDRRVLFTSPVLAAGTNPAEMLVMLHGETHVFIEVNGAGDGTECDHVDLADAAFLLAPNAPDPTPEKPSCVCPGSTK